MSEKKPFEIAKETLKQLTERKLIPTPLNYQKIYNDIAGVEFVPPFPADNLRDIVKALPAKTPGQQKQKGLLEYAIDRLNWDGVKTAMVAYGGFVPATNDVVTAAAGAASSPSVLSSTPNNTAPALTNDFLVQIGRMIEFLKPALGMDEERFVTQTETLLAAIRQPVVDVIVVKQMLTAYSDRLSFVAEDQAEIKKTLLKLLHLMFENIAELSQDEHWLKGQMDALMTASAPPLTLRRLDDVERRLKDVIFKQKDAKGHALQAQEEMRKMLATFIERLSQITKSSDSFHSQMEESARLIEQAKSMTEIAPVLKEVMQATRNMAHDSKTSHDELLSMREHATATEAEIAKLHQELDRVSALARHDPLTGALNRKGLDEAMEREISNVRRKDVPLCVALLDIDNFKKINDSMGHSTGDAALTHLATVARECMRPQDNLARYGGEEFVILLPDTTLDKGIEALTRLQRELTKKFFLSGVEKVLITFSAGVVQLATDEKGATAIKRADQAMYLAKRAGKNRVVGA
jgi:diguanylate cyclase